MLTSAGRHAAPISDRLRQSLAQNQINSNNKTYLSVGIMDLIPVVTGMAAAAAVGFPGRCDLAVRRGEGLDHGCLLLCRDTSTSRSTSCCTSSPAENRKQGVSSIPHLHLFIVMSTMLLMLKTAAHHSSCYIDSTKKT